MNDVKYLATLFEDDGEYIPGEGTTMSVRYEIANSDPIWWNQYGRQKIFNPTFHSEESNISVSTIGKWGLAHRYPQRFYLVKNDGKWIFSKIAIER